MTVLNEHIEVPRPAVEAFSYIADFATTEEWDATVRRAEKLTPGRIRVGTRFRVNCALPVGSVDLDYEVVHLEPNQRIDLHGTCRWFRVEDSIRFSETGTEDEGDIRTRIDYRAAFFFKPPLDTVVGPFTSALQRMGKASMRGLLEALRDNYPAPAASRGNRLGDRLLLPGLALFTRHGYTRGRRQWHPMSAYMGDKHVLITGASSGLGYATALEIARRGATLTLVMRNPERARETVQKLTEATGNPKIRYELADLSLLAEVDALVARLRRRDEAIDVLVNNAGALFNERAETSEGIERSLALLLLSPVRLTTGLKPLLLKAVAPRVINVVSGGMYSQPLDVGRLTTNGDNWSGAVAYARCKRALTVATEQWADAWAGEGIVVNAMHPGWADTPGVESALPRFHSLMERLLRSPEEGADTIVWMAVASEAGRASGNLYLDREPHTTHLLAGTRETPAERERLRAFLADYEFPGVHRGRRTARRVVRQQAA